MLSVIRQTIGDDQRQPSDCPVLGSLPVEQYNHLQIFVQDSQDSDVFKIHCTSCIRTKAFCNGSPRNHWVLVHWQDGGEKSYGDLRGRVVARLLALFQIRNVQSGAGDVHHLELVHILNPLGASRFHLLKRVYTSQSGVQSSRYGNSRYMGSEQAGACDSERGEAIDSESQD